MTSSAKPRSAVRNRIPGVIDCLTIDRVVDAMGESQALRQRKATRYRNVQADTSYPSLHLVKAAHQRYAKEVPNDCTLVGAAPYRRLPVVPELPNV
jgi:hypothetical protein